MAENDALNKTAKTKATTSNGEINATQLEENYTETLSSEKFDAGEFDTTERQQLKSEQSFKSEFNNLKSSFKTSI